MKEGGVIPALYSTQNSPWFYLDEVAVPQRQYFKYSIVKLEQLFESSKGDRAVLKDLRDELEHR
jgi:hypothetical protein